MANDMTCGYGSVHGDNKPPDVNRKLLAMIAPIARGRATAGGSVRWGWSFGM